MHRFTLKTEAEDALAIRTVFMANEVSPIYGGGSGHRQKGHGYWLEPKYGAGGWVPATEALQRMQVAGSGGNRVVFGPADGATDEWVAATKAGDIMEIDALRFYSSLSILPPVYKRSLLVTLDSGIKRLTSFGQADGAECVRVFWCEHVPSCTVALKDAPVRYYCATVHAHDTPEEFLAAYGEGETA